MRETGRRGYYLLPRPSKGTRRPATEIRTLVSASVGAVIRSYGLTVASALCTIVSTACIPRVGAHTGGVHFTTYIIVFCSARTYRYGRSKWRLLFLSCDLSLTAVFKSVYWLLLFEPFNSTRTVLEYYCAVRLKTVASDCSHPQCMTKRLVGPISFYT
jgi:hypothetical protein